MSMPRITKRLAIITAGIALAVSASVTPYANAEVRLDPNNDYQVLKFLAKGDTPYIDFTTVDGKQVTNESLKGKLVVVDVWATWCVPCMQALPHFKDLVATYGEHDDIEFISVSMDKDLETLKKGIQDNDMTWTQVFDGDRNINKAWNVGMIPTVVVIAPDGTALYAGHPMGMDEPLQAALKEYVPTAYDAEKDAEYKAKAEAELKAREEAMAKARAAAEAQAAAAYKPGSHPLSELDLTDIEGNKITAESLEGKVVIMDFWATWCGPCMASMPHMKELYAKHHEADGVEVIAVNRDRDIDTLRKTKQEVGMPWKHVFDGDASISKKFNVTGIPQIFIFSRTGEYLWSGHPVNMDEPLAKILADDSLTAEAFAKKDDGRPKSIPMVTKTPAQAAPQGIPAATIKPMPAPKEPVEKRVLLDPGAKPQFTLNYTDGSTVTNEDLKGKIVVMDFWATWCGPCMASMPHMIELNKKYADKGVQVVGISLDRSEDTLKKTVADKGMDWPQHYDGDRVITRKFGVSGIPTIYILSPEGEVLWRGHPSDMDEHLEKAIAEYQAVS